MRVAVDFLKDTVAELLISMGAEVAEAALIAQGLVAADLRGVRTHGVSYLPQLVERIRAGLMTVPTTLTVVSDEGAILHLDGGNGTGQVAAARGMQTAIERARAFGVGLALIRSTNNIGMLAFYSSMAADAGMVGLCATNAAPSMAPWGAATAGFGSNPLSIAAPTSGPSIVLDMSTTLASRGKVRRALREREAIPAGWALDVNGIPTEDPAAALAGTLLPIGGPKGSGLAFFVDIVCGLLSGSRYGVAVKSFHENDGPTGTGAMMLAIDIARFMPLDRFEAMLAEYGQSIRAMPKASGVGRVRLPGDIEIEREADNLANGVDVDDLICARIDELLRDAGIARRLTSGAAA